jgi:hypothetical protein
VIPGGFTLNSYLITGEEPLLFHTGYRKLFPFTLEAIGKVMPIETLRWIGVLTSLNDFAARPARGLGDGEEFSIGSRRMKWLYTPHVPHGWDCGILLDLSTQTLLCRDLFTQPGSNMPPVTESKSSAQAKECAA